MNFLPHRRSLAVRDALLCSPEALAGRRLCCCTPPAAGCSRGLPGFGRCGICAKSSDSLRKICVRISQHHVQTVCIVSRSALAEQAPMKLNASNQHLISAAATTTSAAASATAATATLALLRQRRVMVDGICSHLHNQVVASTSRKKSSPLPQAADENAVLLCALLCLATRAVISHAGHEQDGLRPPWLSEHMPSSTVVIRKASLDALSQNNCNRTDTCLRRR